MALVLSTSQRVITLIVQQPSLLSMLYKVECISVTPEMLSLAVLHVESPVMR